MKAYDRFRIKITDRALVKCVHFVDAPHRAYAHYPQDLVRITLYWRPDTLYWRPNTYFKSMRFLIDMSGVEALKVARDLIVVANSTKEYTLQRSEFYGS